MNNSIQLAERLRPKKFDDYIGQKQLASILEISDKRISELLNGKRKLNIEIAKKIYQKLNIDASFLLEIA